MLGAGRTLLYGALAGAAAESILYPLEVLRRRSAPPPLVSMLLAPSAARASLLMPSCVQDATAEHASHRGRAASPASGAHDPGSGNRCPQSPLNPPFWIRCHAFGNGQMMLASPIDSFGSSSRLVTVCRTWAVCWGWHRQRAQIAPHGSSRPDKQLPQKGNERRRGDLQGTHVAHCLQTTCIHFPTEQIWTSAAHYQTDACLCEA